MIHNSAEGGESVTGFFESFDDAEEAIEQLYGLGLTAQQISTTTAESTSGSVAPSSHLISVPAGVGAAIGGLFGAFLGWAIAVGAVVLPGVTTEALPGVGTTVGSAVLAAMLTALLLGAGIGALIAALIASGARSGVVARQSGVLITAHPPSSDLTSRVADILRVNGATRLGSESASIALPASLFTGSEKENDIMAEDQVGRDPNSLTGTKGAFDPETGVYGTAGTPLTTGYGVSGSTTGIGSEAGEETHEDADFKGSTPNSMAYETGGRSSTDDLGARLSPNTGPSVVDKNSDKGRQEEASIPIEPEEQDIYEQMPGYGESLNRTPGMESTASDVDPASDIETTPSERRNASNAGTTDD